MRPTGIITRMRDLPAILTRTVDGGSREMSPQGDVQVLASTAAPVSFGSYREILSHAPDACDTKACRSLLINHDPNQIAGSVSNFSFDGTRCVLSARIHNDARMQSGPKVRDLVKDGTLGGVSVGYTYDSERDADWDDQTRTLTVRNWRMLEASLTPIPRDADAQVMRSLPPLPTKRAELPEPTPVPQGITMPPEALAKLLRSFPDHAAFIAERIEAGDKEPKTIEAAIAARVAAANDEKARAAAIAGERAARLALDITLIAESHGLSGAAYRDFGSVQEATARMLKDKAEAEAKARGGLPRIPGADVVVTADAADKFRDAAIDGLLSRSGVMMPTDNGVRDYARAATNLGMRNISIISLARECMIQDGRSEREVRGMSNIEIATWIRDMPRFVFGAHAQRAANQAYGQFPGILANYMDKAIALGFQGYEDITYPQWTRSRPVNDFKPFINAALTLGNLVQTAENVAFPELAAKDLSYQSQVGMWGGTLTLSYQALASDDLGEFMRNLGMAGGIAQRTVDKQCASVLVNYNWTATGLTGLDNITGRPLGTQDNLDAVRNAFRKKISPTGVLLGNSPKILMHPVPLARAADQALGNANPPGEPSYLASNRARSIRAIENNYLDDPTLAGGSSTNYFLFGGSDVDGVLVATLTGMQVPQVMEFDPGATADRKFKIMFPFVAYVASYTDSNGIANRPVGITRGTP